MGTRHYQKVVTKDGVIKVAQYGQWDGYPSGQGLGILEFLRTQDLNKYQDNLIKLRWGVKEDYEKIDEWAKGVRGEKLDYDEERKLLHQNKQHYALSRDCGSNVHKLILDGDVEYLLHTTNAEADRYCEGFYTIDFNQNKFIVEYHGTVKEYDLTNLPTEEEFLNDFDEEN